MNSNLLHIPRTSSILGLVAVGVLMMAISGCTARKPSCSAYQSLEWDASGEAEAVQLQP